MDDKFPYKIGDVIKIYQKITEGKKERVASFKGTIVRIKGNGSNTMFTVRQKLEGINVDRIYPFHMPGIQKIEFVESPKKPFHHANLQNIVK